MITNADDKKGHEVAARFEQMRLVFGQLLMRSKINLPEPLEILAFRSAEEYAALAPLRDGKPIAAPGFFLPGEDRNYIVLDLSTNESWRAVSYDFARMLLNYNYPPAQPWFDEGFAEYLSSFRLQSKIVQIGGDPGLVPPLTQPFADLLTSQPWLPIAQLFATTPPGPRDSLFAAQSWIVMHYLLNKNKLEETGTYFDLVQNQQVSIADAIQKAYGMSPAQMDQAIKEYFQALLPLLQKPAQKGAAALLSANVPTVADDEEIGASRQNLSESDGEALVAEVTIRIPGHETQARKSIENLISQPKTDSSVAHRALAWSYLRANQYEETVDELTRAADLDPKDPWLHYYLSLAKYHAAQASGQPFQGLANMMQDLKVVLTWDPEFAEAYCMLGMARVEGGGIGSAMEAMRAAIRLSPRNQTYLLNMAQIYIAAKQWKAASALLQRLSTSNDPRIAEAAKKNIADLPTLEKYGVLPQHDTTAAASNAASSPAKPPAATAPAPKPAAKPPAAPAQPPQTEAEETDDHEPVPPQPDRRPIQFAKGKLLSVDCSQTPQAMLTVSTGTRSLKLLTSDYNSMTLIGADAFSCDWKNRAVSVNYKAGGKADGDLVSIEIH